MTEEEAIASLRQYASDVKISLKFRLLFVFYGYVDENGQGWMSEYLMERMRELSNPSI